jgi:hypothetical protein
MTFERWGGSHPATCRVKQPLKALQPRDHTGPPCGEGEPLSGAGAPIATVRDDPHAETARVLSQNACPTA